MKIAVTVKVVPDTTAEKKIDPATKRLVRTGVNLVMNPYDEYALEAALRLKEQLGADTTVTVVSMYPENGKETIRRALAMGADDAYLISDAALEGSDAWETGVVLGAALRKIGFDLIVCGGLSDDGTTGAVPGALAEDLGVPGIANVRHIESAQGSLKVQCETDNGYQVVNGPLPALISVTMAVGEPRYPSLKGIMGAKKKPITTFTVADLGVADAAGEAHAKTELLSFAPPAARGKGEVVKPDDAAQGARLIFDYLKERKLV
jgi:electron transfer flavoprotein beta subunit